MLSDTESACNTGKVNLVGQILKQGERLRSSIVQTIITNEPFSADILKPHFTCSHNTQTGPLMHSINNDELRSPQKYVDNSKFRAYLRGDKMSKSEEREALETFRSMSNSAIIEATDYSQNTNNTCECDTCKAYERNVEGFEYTNKKDAGDETLNNDHCLRNDRLPKEVFKYVDSLKICVHSLHVNKEGKKKVYSVPTKLNMCSYFIDYNIPNQLLKSQMKIKNKVDTGLNSMSTVRMCSKKCNNNAIYFKQISIHNIHDIQKIDLSNIDIKFRISSRVSNQKGINVLGYASFNLGSFYYNIHLNCCQEIPVALNDNIPIVLGSIRLSLQLGCGKIYFGQEYIDALNNRNEINILSETFCAEEILSGSVVTSLNDKIDKKIIDQTVENGFTTKKNFTNVTDNSKKEITSRKTVLGKNDVKVSGVTDTRDKLCSMPKVMPERIEERHILFGFIYVSQAQYLDAKCKTYLSCRPFGQDDVVFSIAAFGSLNPLFNFKQRVPYIYDEQFLCKLRDNCMVIEFWEENDSKKSIIGLAKLSIHQFYLAYRNPEILKYLSRNKLPVIGTDWWEPITDPITNETTGQTQILLALGSQSQIDTLLLERGFNEENVRNNKLVTLEPKPTTKTKTAVKVTCLKRPTSSIQSNKSSIKSAASSTTTLSHKVDVGVQSEMAEKDPPLNSKNTQDMLGAFLTKLISQTTVRAQTVDTAVNTDTENEINSNTDNNLINKTAAIPSVSTVQRNPVNVRQTGDLLDSLQLALREKSLMTQNNFRVQVVIEKALHLPTRKKCKSKKAKGKNAKIEEILPSTYVTFETTSGKDFKITQIVQKSANPEWNWKLDVFLPVNLLTNSEKRLIFKVWKKSNNASSQPNMQLDSIIGFAALDLSVLTAGLPTVEGWFNILDFASTCNGQIKISIIPLESVAKFSKQYSTNSTATSTQQNTTRSGNTATPISDNSPSVPSDDEPSELLNRTLKRKFTELDEITDRLRSRLSDVTRDETDEQLDDFSEDFDRDINTLCIEDDYDMLDFAKEAQKVQFNQVSRSLKQLQDEQQCLLLAENCTRDEEFNVTLATTQDGCTSSSSMIDSVVASSSNESAPVTVTGTEQLDIQLVAGKQRIDTLLQKLTLFSAGNSNINEMFAQRYVSGCSVRNEETEVDSNLLVLTPLEIDCNTSENVSSSDLQLDTSNSRVEPDGEGNSTD